MYVVHVYVRGENFSTTGTPHFDIIKLQSTVDENTHTESSRTSAKNKKVLKKEACW